MAGYPLHLKFAVTFHIVAFPTTGALPGALFAKVDTADEIPHQQQVQSAVQHLVFQRGIFPQVGVELGRAQVAEQIKATAQGGQAAFRALGPGKVVPLGPAGRTKQNGITFPAELQCFRLDGHAVGINAAAAYQALHLMELMPVNLADLIQRTNRFPDDIYADAVAGDHSNFILHDDSSLQYQSAVTVRGSVMTPVRALAAAVAGLLR